MSRLVNPVTVRPDELQHGAVMAVTVTVHIIERGGRLYYRMYRCEYPPQTRGEVPQGFRANGELPASALMPVLGYAEVQEDNL